MLLEKNFDYALQLTQYQKEFEAKLAEKVEVYKQLNSEFNKKMYEKDQLIEKFVEENNEKLEIIEK